MNIFLQEFTTGQVISATGVSGATLQTWLKRDVIVGHKTTSPIEGGGSPGVYRRWCFYNVMEVALGKALTDLGVPLQRAFYAATMFSHTGDAARNPGVPFIGRFRTLLCVSPSNVEIVAWTPGVDVLPGLRNGARPFGVTILEVDPIFDTVVSALGHHPEDVLSLSRSELEALSDGGA